MGDDTELAKINFDLKKYRVKQVITKRKELLRIQVQKIDALKAEDAAKNNKKKLMILWHNKRKS